jgi:hypothetical protein
MTDVARRQARSGQRRLDGALLERRRQAALAALGEAVYDLAARGELGELERSPELAGALDEVEAIEQRMAEADEAPRPGSPRAAWQNVPRTGGRPGRPERAERFERREGGEVWRPPRDVEPPPEMEDAELEGVESRRRRERATEAATPRRKRVARPQAGAAAITFVEDGGTFPPHLPRTPRTT